MSRLIFSGPAELQVPSPQVLRFLDRQVDFVAYEVAGFEENLLLLDYRASPTNDKWSSFRYGGNGRFPRISRRRSPGNLGIQPHPFADRTARHHPSPSTVGILPGTHTWAHSPEPSCLLPTHRHPRQSRRHGHDAGSAV